MADFAARIRELRLQHRPTLSQYDLAQRVGCQPILVSRWETGRTGRPSGRFLRRLSRLFEVSEDYILGATDDRTPSKKEVQEWHRQDALERR